MAARNVRSPGPSRRPKPIKGYFWTPPVDGSIYKIEIITDSQTYDVTDEIHEGEFTDGITETIGNFNFTIDNSIQQYTGVFSIYDTIKIYMNYGASATILTFGGLIERPAFKDNKVVVSGQGSALRTINKKVTYSATDVARSDVLIAIIEKYFTGVITTTNVETDSDLITVSYEDKYFWEVVEELTAAGGFDAYIDPVFDFHYFESGSRLNTTDAAVHESNLIETGDFASDLQGEVNRVTVYGQKIGDSLILATANDVPGQTRLSGDIRDLIINDGNIKTVAEAQARADFELAKNSTAPTIGEVTSLLLPTLSPGEMVRISDPLNGIEPGNYAIQKYTHKFSNDEPPMTTLTVQKERTSIPTILKKRIRFETEITEGDNPNEMNHSVFYDFTSDVGTHSSTQIDTELGILKTDGSASGSWTTDITNTTSNVTDIEPRISGSNILGTTVFISLDGGQTFVRARFHDTSFSLGNVGTIPDGRNIRARIDLVSATTEITSFSLLYKKE